mgnify:CR=1 FL=1|tara:strand:- start:37 stop:363 length:327 start_codon:yes stop_codon:yes gene_type:complete
MDFNLQEIPQFEPEFINQFSHNMKNINDHIQYFGKIINLHRTTLSKTETMDNKISIEYQNFLNNIYKMFEFLLHFHKNKETEYKFEIHQRNLSIKFLERQLDKLQENS